MHDNTLSEIMVVRPQIDQIFGYNGQVLQDCIFGNLVVLRFSFNLPFFVKIIHIEKNDTMCSALFHYH